MKILVSACLLGENCKYNGGNNLRPAVVEYVKDKPHFPLCPELLAGLGCPRTPIEICDGKLVDREGRNVDEAMGRALAQAMERVRQEAPTQAVLMSRSPTCGVNQVYDGTFSGRLIPGSGIFAQALREAGIPVVDAEDL